MQGREEVILKIEFLDKSDIVLYAYFHEHKLHVLKREDQADRHGVHEIKVWI